MSRPTRTGLVADASSGGREGERGQLLVIFTLALTAMIAMTGLIIDGGDTFLQRRDQQNVADAAAMAAGYASVNGQDASAAAQAAAVANGYTNGQNGAVVTVVVGTNTVRVDVTKPHRNFFAGVVGFTSWNVSATATVQAGIPNAVIGAMPLIFNKTAFKNAANKNSAAPASFGEPGNGNQDVPQTNTSFNWTVFCTANGNPCNGNSNTVDNLINDRGSSTTIYVNELIGPLNAGAHTDLFSSLADHLGKPYPVALVNDNGSVYGWAYFHLTGSVGGNTKQISGWFEDQVNAPPMKIVQGHGAAQGSGGAYSVKLTN